MDYYTIFLIGCLSIALIVALLKRRNEKELAPVYRSKYDQAKFVATRYYVAVILTFISLIIIIRQSEALRFPASVTLLGIFLVSMALHRFFIERRLKSADLPNEFVRKERLFDVGMSLLGFVFLAVALLV